VEGPKDRALAGGLPRLKSVHDQRGWDALIAIGYSIQQPRPRHPQAASEEDRSRLKKKLQRAVAAEHRKHLDAKLEVWAADEHRIGLKPIIRGVWAPIGERPIALSHHRFEWLYVTGFVEPATGSTVWNVSNNISKAYFELVLADFAKSVVAARRSASSCRSTTQAGTGQRTSPCPTASAWCSSLPQPRAAPPSTCGRSSTSPSSTVTSRPSRPSTKSSASLRRAHPAQEMIRASTPLFEHAIVQSAE